MQGTAERRPQAPPGSSELPQSRPLPRPAPLRGRAGPGGDAHPPRAPPPGGAAEAAAAWAGAGGAARREMAAGPGWAEGTELHHEAVARPSARRCRGQHPAAGGLLLTLLPLAALHEAISGLRWVPGEPPSTAAPPPTGACEERDGHDPSPRQRCPAAAYLLMLCFLAERGSASFWDKGAWLAHSRRPQLWQGWNLAENSGFWHHQASRVFSCRVRIVGERLGTAVTTGSVRAVTQTGESG